MCEADSNLRSCICCGFLLLWHVRFKVRLVEHPGRLLFTPWLQQVVIWLTVAVHSSLTCAVSSIFTQKTAAHMMLKDKTTRELTVFWNTRMPFWCVVLTSAYLLTISTSKSMLIFHWYLLWDAVELVYPSKWPFSGAISIKLNCTEYLNTTTQRTSSYSGMSHTFAFLPTFVLFYLTMAEMKKYIFEVFAKEKSSEVIPELVLINNHSKHLRLFCVIQVERKKILYQN